MRAHPSTPAYHSIQAALDRHQSVDLAPYYVPGNFLTRQRYSTLPLPWTLPNPVTAFDQTTFYRKEWDPEQGEHFYTGDTEVPMSRFELMLSTSSPVVRLWSLFCPAGIALLAPSHSSYMLICIRIPNASGHVGCLLPLRLPPSRKFTY